jgi:inosose dehydratase
MGTPMIRVANAPCSWGVLEFEGTAAPATYDRVLDEIRDTGYAGTELGDWGFMPTDPDSLKKAVADRDLRLIGAFVPVALVNPAAHEAGVAAAVRTARLLRAAGAPDAVVVLSDENASVPKRERNAGRITAAHAMTEHEWAVFVSGADLVARAVSDQTGLRTVFHPHCGGYVETMSEIDSLMAHTDASTLGLCLDTGHITYSGGDSLQLLERYGARVWHVHFKDCDPHIAAAVRAAGSGYLTAVQSQVFCELGSGVVDFPAVLDRLRRQQYDGWIVVEQDVFAGGGAPAESARRNRMYLRSLGV